MRPRTRFTWHDLNGDKLFTSPASELNLNSTDQEHHGGQQRVLNPNLKSPNI
jgi:hypothetical protein